MPSHPLHAKGYPSIGDAKDTIPIPEDGSVRWVNNKWEGDMTKWCDYATERKVRLCFILFCCFLLLLSYSARSYV